VYERRQRSVHRCVRVYVCEGEQEGGHVV